MNTIPYPDIKTVRQPGNSPKRRKAEQAIRDATKRRMDGLYRRAHGRGWCSYLLWCARLVWDIQARALAKLDRP